MQFGREEERYAIKFCFKLGKNAATETYGILQTAFRPSYMNRASVLSDIGGARGVMVIVAGYGHGDTSSNPGPD